ncbi:MAG: hypothetical protein AAF281_12980, partial [Pseudomonadota bacterium]
IDGALSNIGDPDIFAARIENLSGVIEVRPAGRLENVLTAEIENVDGEIYIEGRWLNTLEARVANGPTGFTSIVEIREGGNLDVLLASVFDTDRATLQTALGSTVSVAERGVMRALGPSVTVLRGTSVIGPGGRFEQDSDAQLLQFCQGVFDATAGTVVNDGRMATLGGAFLGRPYRGSGRAVALPLCID